MTKFLHTADWQLGMTRHFLSDEAQARFTAARIEAITSIGALAVEEGCSFVVVGGDVFESNQVERQVVVRSLEAMKSTPDVTFYLLPGNHDPLDAASVFRSKTLRRQLSGQRGRAREQRPGPRGRWRRDRRGTLAQQAAAGRPGHSRRGRAAQRRHAPRRRRARRHRQPLAQSERPGARGPGRPRSSHRRRHRALRRPGRSPLDDRGGRNRSDLVLRSTRAHRLRRDRSRQRLDRRPLSGLGQRRTPPRRHLAVRASGL